MLNWNEYFMYVAILSGQRSKDPNTKVGACIVNNEKRIVGVGYNGMPSGCDDSEFPWNQEGEGINHKYLYVVHAELNAILNATCKLNDCTLYVSLFPCNECCKAIIQSGIKKVYYISDKYAHTDSVLASKRMFDAAKVAYEKLKMDTKKVLLTLDE